MVLIYQFQSKTYYEIMDKNLNPKSENDLVSERTVKSHLLGHVDLNDSQFKLNVTRRRALRN